ncbi:9851_t:CDS:2, partial [Gigaspora margarita]
LVNTTEAAAIIVGSALVTNINGGISHASKQHLTIPRRKQAKDAQHKVRLMTPYAMRCETCGEYIYKGKKFNARKETVEGETYLSIKIFRFYIKCPRCSAEITFKTDPRNTDYIAEHGASRNFEPWREERIAGEESKLQKELEEENNPMKALENRTIDSKREMDILDALDEIRTRNARNEHRVKRVIDEEPELAQLLSESAKSFVIPKFKNTSSAGDNKGKEGNKRKNTGSEIGIIIKKKKIENNNSLGSLMENYGSSEDSE